MATAQAPRVQIKIVDAEMFYFKAIRPSGSIHRIGLDGTSVMDELAIKRNQGWIIVSGACPGNICGGRFADEEGEGAPCGERLDNPAVPCPKCGSKAPTCSKTKMSPTLCTYQHALPKAGLEWPEKDLYPLGILDPKLRTIIAERVKKQNDERIAHANTMPQAQAARQNVQNMAAALGTGSAANAALEAQLAETKAENADLKAGLAATNAKLDALLEGLTSQKKK